VDRRCGEAVLRGAEIFVPGVLGCSPKVEIGDEVCVSVAVEPLGSSSCGMTRGTTLGSQHESSAVTKRRVNFHIGRAKACIPRHLLFNTQHGVAFEMVSRIFDMPACEGLLEGQLVLQNLPSIVAAHALAPPPGSTVLDMCAAPGGKTAALAALMQNQGCIYACDRTHKKVDNIKQLAHKLGITCITALKLDSSRIIPDAVPPSFKATLLAGGKSVQGNAVSKEGDDAAPIAKRVGSSKPEQLPETTPSVLPQWWSALRRSVEWICTKTGLAAAKKEINQAASAAAIRKSLVSPELARKTAERVKNRQERKRRAAEKRGHVRADEAHHPAGKKQRVDGGAAVSLAREQFKYILLDGPCSAMGLRPRLNQTMEMSQLWQHVVVQRQLLHQAVALLSPGGFLVYSTCTINPGENESNVRYALDTFPCLSLVEAAPLIGGPGFCMHTSKDGTMEHWLSEEESRLVQRFDPTPTNDLDTIGFFIAKFQKA